MSYPQHPGNWSDPSWPNQSAAYKDPGSPHPGSGAPYTDPSAYQASYAGYGYAAHRPTNGLAIASLVCSLAGLATCISAPVGAILGHVARRQIRERGEAGDGMALAGIVVGWILTGLGIAVIALYAILIIVAINDPSFDNSSY
jgi:hypothetical protein